MTIRDNIIVSVVQNSAPPASAQIKVHTYTPRDVCFAIADEARQQRLPLAGHVPLTVTIQEGVDAGMVSIEHLSEDGRVWKASSGGSQYRPDACRPFFECWRAAVCGRHQLSLPWWSSQ